MGRHTRLRNVKIILWILVLICVGLTLFNIYAKQYITGIIIFVIFVGFIYSCYKYGYKIIKKECDDELINRL